MIILKIYRNYLRTLRIAKTFYNSFDRNKSGLVKVRGNLKSLRTKVKERLSAGNLYYLIRF